MRNLALMWVLVGVAVALLAAGDGKPSVSTFTDKRDGKVYKIVRIGSQVWFAENLNYAAESSRCYEDSPDSCAKYGRLYDWNTAMTACPAGWHLPDKDEWWTLVDYAGGEEKAGTKLKSSTGWKSYENIPAGTDEYGFSALSGGGSIDSNFYDVGKFGNWWSGTEADDDNTDYAWSRSMDYGDEYVNGHDFLKSVLLSVRCVQDKRKEKRK